MKLRFLGPVYRHTTNRDFAEQIVSGETVWVSTFETCRNYEDSEQGDAGEGTLLQKISYASNDDPRFEEIANRFRMFGPPGTITLTDCKLKSNVPNAYVICFSFGVFDERLKTKFGKFAVEIVNIHDFSLRIVAAMAKIVPVVGAAHGPVIYADRTFQDYQSAPGDPHFVKPISPFKIQREYRLVIRCSEGHEYKPFGVRVALPKKLCSLIDS